MSLNWGTQETIATAFGKGRTHDFKLFKRSCTHAHPDTVVLADVGYLGLERLHTHTFLPARATKHHALTCEEKLANRTLARLRLRIERVVGKLKVFRVLSGRCRGRRKRFNLIAGIYNFELSFEL